MIDVRQITAAETIALRHAVLRPGRPIQEASFPGDDLPTTAHFGASNNGALLCVASLFLVDSPDQPGVTAFQLRGMATTPAAQGSGFGKKIVNACAKFARDSGAKLLWCNARTSAAGFYASLGFNTVSSEFEIPTVGSHVRMTLSLDGG
jgi:predicted GNAT family N-acyltransferase